MFVFFSTTNLHISLQLVFFFTQVKLQDYKASDLILYMDYVM